MPDAQKLKQVNIFQKKVLDEICRMLPLSSCAFNATLISIFFSYRLPLSVGIKDATYSECVDASIEWQFWVHEYINKRLKPFFKIRQSKIALKQALTLKLGVTLVVTVTQVYVFINLR